MLWGLAATHVFRYHVQQRRMRDNGIMAKQDLGPFLEAELTMRDELNAELRCQVDAHQIYPPIQRSKGTYSQKRACNLLARYMRFTGALVTCS